MENYLLFTLVAAITILSPGPAVVLTLTNTIRFGVHGAFSGIVGVAFGTFIVAGISATGLGILLATSAIAFTVVKYIGAAYLMYLGIKLWCSPSIEIDVSSKATKNKKRQFLEGLVLQVTNPKAVFFFISIFPQFIELAEGYLASFFLLVFTYSLLIIVIHLSFALTARSARGWLSSESSGRTVNRVGGGTFMCFGASLAVAQK